MARRFSSQLRRAAHGVTTALCLTLLACGGGGDALAPHGPGADNPDEPGSPGTPGIPDPGTPQIPDNPNPAPPVAGGYTLGLINQSTPGQNVMLANPNGGVIGLYRFLEVSSLVLDPLGSYTLTLLYVDDTHSYSLEDKGGWKGNTGPDGIELSFKSETFGDAFPGLARNGRLEIQYDVDGDENIDTLFGFERTGQ
jgi:hypothetical protein